MALGLRAYRLSKAQFMPVRAGAMLRTQRTRTDPGIADEQIEPLVVGKHRFRKLPRTR
jgi:hypothetical protein